MKRLIFPLLVSLFVFQLGAQPLPKRYVLLEHFTNSWCSTCASKNPAFYNLIDDYPNDVHHIAYHPPIPYNGCVFYQANTVENQARTAAYGVNGTPRVALNGALAPGGGALLQPALLTSEIGETSPLSLTVTESGAGVGRTVKIKAKAWGQIPAGTYRIYAALVEKTINLQTPNGEPVHHDVFRRMLPNIEGSVFAAPAAGEEIEYTYDYTIATAWNANEIYVVAFVQNVATGEILNSGTKFDAPLTTAAGEAAALPLRLAPNPAQDRAVATLSGDRALHAEVFAGDGRRVQAAFSMENDQIALDLSALAPGVYFVKIRGEKSVYTGKIVVRS